ncbi:MAG: hypothetical protein D6705_14725 [Deltaproteobacteria bacterium]|nr:MAG: hypothetical protein D6705_14725 [Deltaproteobacteria bacterium]
MIVRCASCHAEFSLEDEQVGPEGVSLRCSVCGHVFTVAPPDGGEGGTWQVRTVEDLLFTAPDLATLRQWAEEGRLHPDDRISRTGQHWLRVGDMPELAGIFGAGPRLVEPVAPPAERSAAELGPPPDFGSEASDVRPGAASMLDAVSSMAKPGSGPVAIAGGPSPTPPRVGHTMTYDDPEAHAPTQPAITPRPEILGGAPMAPTNRPAAPPGPPGPPPAPPAEPSSAAGTESPSSPSRRRPSSIMREMGLADSQRVDVPGSTTASASWAAGSLAGESIEDYENFGGRRRRRRSRPILWALVGTLGAAGLVFGVPAVRSVVFEQAGRIADMVRPKAAGRVDVPELAEVDAVLETLDPAGVGRTEAALQARLDEGGLSAAEKAAVQVAQARLLAMRALAAQVGAALANEPSMAEEGDQLARQAAEILGRVDVEQVPDRDALRRTRALVRLATGRGPEEVLPLLPGGERDVLAPWVRAAPLWRDPKAPVPPGTIAALRDGHDDLFSQLVLSLAMRRAGDEAGARAALEAARAVSPSHPLLERILGGAPAGTSGAGTGAQEAEGPPSGTSGATAEPDAPAPPTEASTTAPKKGAPGGSGMSTDRLIERGCDLVDRGQARKGIELLLRAFDRRPGDLDVLVCLAKGNAALGRGAVAQGYYDRALRRSPKHRTALLGAARLAAKMGQKERALRLYERVLGVDPNNAEAKRFVAQAKPPAKQPDAAPVDAPATPPSP